MVFLYRARCFHLKHPRVVILYKRCATFHRNLIILLIVDGFALSVVMHNMKRKIAETSSSVPDQASLERKDHVTPSPNQLWRRHFPVNIQRFNRQRDALTQKLKDFWARQNSEIENIAGAPVSYALPLLRIKRVMKSNPNVQNLSSDTPVILAKAIELFIMELTLRSWMHTEMSSRQTLQARDIADAVKNSELHNYLGGLVKFERRSVNHQCKAKPVHASHPQVVPPAANVNVASTKAPLDLDEIMQQSLDSDVADRFIDVSDVELSPNIK